MCAIRFGFQHLPSVDPKAYMQHVKLAEVHVKRSVILMINLFRFSVAMSPLVVYLVPI